MEYLSINIKRIIFFFNYKTRRELTPALNLGEIAYLSLVEIITLQKLLAHQEPVVRFILYQEVNQVVNPKLTYKLNAENLLANSLKSSGESKKELSTSSFYSNLRSLEKKGLVSFIKDKKNKIEAVKATERVREALMTIVKNLLLLLIDDSEILLSLVEELTKKTGVNHFETLLTVSLTEEVNLNLLSFYNQMADRVYFLAEEEVFQNMIKIGYDKMEYTRMMNKIIREPNNIFDVAIVPNYEKEPNFYEL